MKIKMDYVLMGDMKREFMKSAEHIEQSLSKIQDMAGLIEDDGLKGQGGKVLVEAMNVTLAKKMQEIHSKFIELAEDIQSAVDSMQEADADTRNEMGM